MKFDRCGSALDFSAFNNIPLASATLSCWPVCHVQPSTTTRTIDVTTFPSGCCSQFYLSRHRSIK